MGAWSPDEDKLLTEAIEEGGIKLALERLSRSERAIRCRASRLGLRYYHWTKKEDQIILRFYRKYGSRLCRHAIPRRSLHAIRQRARDLGVRRDLTSARAAVDYDYDRLMEAHRWANYVRWT